MNLIFKKIHPQRDISQLNTVNQFLQQSALSLEPDCELIIGVQREGKLVGCGAIAGNVLKCIAVDPTLQGEGLSLKLLTELVTQAYEMGRCELFLFTRPKNIPLFSGAGFWPIAQAGDQAVLMENSSDRLARYCRQLAMYRQSGKRIGAIVMNANPFTLGHRWLIQQAARQCDWLHLFIVKEDASYFRYSDRWQLIAQGIEGIPHVTLHPGSAWIISRATFPGYFLKDQGVVDECHSQIDLHLFREHLAPALGISHRFVGNEPLCRLTHAYNQRMKAILSATESHRPAIEVVELPRLEKNGAPVSASRVRKLYAERDWKALAALVPNGTLDFLTRLAASQAETV